jgi:adenylate cyclase
MTTDPKFPLLEKPVELARFQGWSQSVYEDLLAVESGRMTEAEFDEKYLATRAILVLDVTGFTLTTIHGGAINSFLRILDVQKICFPVLQEYGATLIRAFADDVTALFDDCNAALDASIEIHRRIDSHNRSDKRHETPP